MLSGHKHGAYECSGRCSAVNLQCGEAWQTAGSDSSVFKSDRQVSDCHDETWSVILLNQSQARPEMRNASQKSSGWGNKNKELGMGTKFKFGQLVLRKIIKIVATKCHILRLKCTKLDFGWGSASDRAG